MILDAALELHAEGGPGAITASGVARHLGAPSGSIYHRFSSRIALAAALWNRTVAQFQDAFFGPLEHTCPRQGALNGARSAFRWLAEHPKEAALLLAGPRVAGTETWPSAAQQERDQRQQALGTQLATLARRLDLPLTRVSFALVDIPSAAVRRQLRSPDPAWERLALEAIESLLVADST